MTYWPEEVRSAGHGDPVAWEEVKSTKSHFLAAVPQGPAVIVVCPDPFELFIDPRNARHATEGETLADSMPTTPGAWLCVVNGEAIPREHWHYMPPPGCVVQWRCLPQGGGGSNPLRFALQIAAVVAISYFTGPTGLAWGNGLGATLGRAALMIGASALINNLVPVETPKQGSPTYSAQAQGNVARIGQPIPEVFGFDNGFPDLGAQPYSTFGDLGLTESSPLDNQQYLHVFLVVGVGTYRICRVSVGDTSIESFSDVEVVRIGPNQDALTGPGTGVENIGDQSVVDTRWIVNPDVSMLEMRPAAYTGPFTSCPPGKQVDRIRINLIQPGGMTREVRMRWRFEYRLIDDDDVPLGTWVEQGSYTTTRESNVPRRWGTEFDIPVGRHQIRVIRTDEAGRNLADIDQLSWLDLQARVVDADVSAQGCTFIAIKLRATGQLSGGLRFRVMSRRLLPVWDGSAWSEVQSTRNPAWAFAQVLRSRGVPDERIDLDQLLALSAVWDERYDSFDYKFDSQISTWDALSMIARVGRAVPLIRGGRYTVVRDAQESTPVAAYGMRNIRKGSMRMRPVLAASDSMRTMDMEYWDARKWGWRTVTAQIHNGVVYAYREDSVEDARPAGVPEPDPNTRGRIQMPGIVGKNHALRTVAYTLADRYYRSTDVEFDAELDGQIPAPLNLVIFQHDVGNFGQGGDVVSWDAGSLTVETSEPLTWADGAHAIRLMLPNGGLTSAIQVTRVDDTHAILASEPLDLDGNPFAPVNESDMERTRYVFGPQTQVGALAKVRGIIPGDERRIGIRLVLEDNRVHSVDAPWIAPDTLPPCIQEDLAVYTVNVSAVTNGGTSSAVGVVLSGLDPAVIYTLTLPTGGLYTAYSLDSGSTWQNDFRVTDGSGDTNFGSATTFGDADSARTGFPGGTITGSSSYTFWIYSAPDSGAEYWIGTRPHRPWVSEQEAADYAATITNAEGGWLGFTDWRGEPAGRIGMYFLVRDAPFGGLMQQGPFLYSYSAGTVPPNLGGVTVRVTET